jgi:hypothetical protein
MQAVRELLHIRYRQHDLHAWRAHIPELTAVLRVLGGNQARPLATEAWAHYDHQKMLPFLGQLNTSVPGALADWSAAFVAQGHFLPSWLYLDATPSTTRQLLALFDQPEVVTRCNHLLQALAWIGDDLVREQFCAWREDPPPWQSHLFLAAHEYAITAGWELMLDGGRRDLYHQTCYELIPADEPEFTPSRHAVAVSTPTDVSCGWCGRKLAALLDIDLHDPRCAFVVEGEAASTKCGTRLRIAHCQWCSYYATLYTDVDLQGRVRWSDANEDMPSILEKVGLGNVVDLPPPAPRRLVLGSKRRTPFEAVGRFRLDETGISQLGGHPDWIQDTDFPICPSCQRRMRCIGQVSWEDIEEIAEGSTYAFLCLPCGKEASTYQQT